MRRSPLLGRLLLACVGAPALVAALLALVELGFVVAGVDPRQRCFVATTDAHGTPTYTVGRDPPNPGTRFRVDSFARLPPAGTRRIVCVGDSSCFGHPFDPPVPFSYWLDARLKILLPGTPTEVLNLGASGFTSADVLDLLRETDGAGADLLVVYVGHNEFVDRNLLPLKNPVVHALRRALSATRFGTALLARSHRLAEAAAVAQSVHAESVHDAPLFTREELERGRARYRDHLRAIVELERARGAGVVLVHPISDAVDTPVEWSCFSERTPDAERTRFRERLAELRTLRAALEAARKAGGAADPERIAAARTLVDELARIDGGVALLAYERGRLALLEGRIEEARREFEAARDDDRDPIRMTAPMQAILAAVARTSGALAVDPRPALAAAAAPGLAGQNGWFADYCHPDLKAHALLADAILRALARANVLAPESEWRFDAEPSSEEYLRRGGYDAARQSAAWARSALFVLGRSHFGDAGRDYIVTVRRDLERALAADPRCALAWIGLGVVATIGKKADEALSHFERAVAIDPAALADVAVAYRTNAAVKAMFEAAGLVVADGRVKRAH